MGFEEYVPLIDSATRRTGLLSEDLMLTCSLIANFSSEKYIDKTYYEASVGLEKDFVGLSNMDQVFAEETQFEGYKVLSEMSDTHIRKSPKFPKKL